MTTIVVLICASALFVQLAFSQCLGRDPVIGFGGAYGSGWGGYDAISPYDGLGYGVPYSAGFIGLSPSNLAASCGGALAVNSLSPTTPTGLTVASENTIEGNLGIFGQLPFLGAVATDGAFSTGGIGAVLYGCGDGAIGIVSEAPIVAPASIGYGQWPVNAGYKGIGPCGCGGLY
uniref:Chorion class CB protein M5H4 n=1 Tax=Bombyx mori TaxID=7091 RepID=CHCB1_BOMMO|nr:RecName: Full=Chorion class CB protein M5H4; Flags: Precursor [Bombyx mori]AAA27830.1 chorion protein [Bombyx mori]